MKDNCMSAEEPMPAQPSSTSLCLRCLHQAMHLLPDPQMKIPGIEALTISLCACADSFHKPGFKMHTKILHHLFRIVSEDAIKAPLYDREALPPGSSTNNAAYVHQQVSQLLTTSFSNLRPQQVEVSLLSFVNDE